MVRGIEKIGFIRHENVCAQRPRLISLELTESHRSVAASSDVRFNVRGGEMRF